MNINGALDFLWLLIPTCPHKKPQETQHIGHVRYVGLLLRETSCNHYVLFALWNMLFTESFKEKIKENMDKVSIIYEICPRELDLSKPQEDKGG
jgi:hypothetical protein